MVAGTGLNEEIGVLDPRCLGADHSDLADSEGKRTEVRPGRKWLCKGAKNSKKEFSGGNRDENSRGSVIAISKDNSGHCDSFKSCGTNSNSSGSGMSSITGRPEEISGSFPSASRESRIDGLSIGFQGGSSSRLATKIAMKSDIEEPSSDALFIDIEEDLEKKSFVGVLSPRVGALSGLSTSPLLSCVFYACLSVSMTLVNKIILSKFAFEYHIVLLLIQNAVSVVLLLLFRRFGFVEFESFDKTKALSWLPLSVLFLFMLLTAFFALQLLSVPMSTVFKNSATGMVAIGDYFCYGQKLTPGILCAIVLMFLGAFLSATSDLEFNPRGYFFAILNALIVTSYALYMPQAISKSKLSPFGRVYYNNLLSIPLIAIFDMLVTRDVYRMWHESHEISSSLVIVILLSAFIGSFLSLATFHCVRCTSPTTYCMVGSLSKVPLVGVGVVLFHTRMSIESFLFVSISLLAGLVYGYSKAKQKMASS